MGVSKNRGGPPKSSIFNRVFHYKPSILGVPLFLETPIYVCIYLYIYIYMIFIHREKRILLGNGVDGDELQSLLGWLAMWN